MLKKTLKIKNSTKFVILFTNLHLNISREVYKMILIIKYRKTYYDVNKKKNFF